MVPRHSVPIDVWYCNGVTSLGDDRKLGDGGRGGESSCDGRCATLVLEAVCRRHLYSTSSQQSAGIPGAPEQRGAQHPLHCGG